MKNFYNILTIGIFLVCAGADGAAASETIKKNTTPISVEKSTETIRNIDTENLKKLLQKRPDTAVIDVRNLTEVHQFGGSIHSQNHHHIPRGWLEFRVADAVPDKTHPIVVYCGTNQRSPLAAKTLMQMGYTDVQNYPDGFFSWQEAELPVGQNDRAPNSALFSLPEEVLPGIWSAIGETYPRTYENNGHNNNLSFIVTSEGVLIFNAGDNYILAKALHEEIEKITDKPIRYVVLENGQGHAALGSSYWKEQGVPIIAHVDAEQELEEGAFEILNRMRNTLRDKAIGTELVLPDQTFEEKLVIELGGERMELLNLGPAHSPGDIMLWMPDRKLVISGDMAFHVRMLPVFEHTDTGGWIETWKKFEALGAEVVIPGHGGPTDMATVTKWTRDYLVHMRTEIGKIIEDGGDIQAAYGVDQSAYEHLDTYEFLARQNAGRIFRAMEFE
ncbi:MAG: MBL fold metallo-hydrolase [bacterium]